MQKLQRVLFCLGLFFTGNIFTFFLNERTGHIKEVFSFKLPLAEIIFLGLFLITFWQERKNLKIFLNSYLFYLLLLSFYLLSILLSVIYATEKIVVLKDVLQLSFYSLGILFILFSRNFDFTFILKSVFAIALFHFSAVVFNYIAGFKNLPYGFFDHPNQLAIFVAMLLPIGFGLEKKISRWVLVLFFFLGGISLFITQKRGALLGAIGGLIFTLFLTRKQTFSLKNIILVILIIGAGIIGLEKRFAVKGIELRKYFTWEEIQTERGEWWKKSGELFKQSPLVGIGSSNFPLYFFDVEAHNLIFKLLSETGLLGFFSFMSILVYAFIHSLKYSFLTGSLLVIFVFSMFNPAPFFIRGVGCIAWILLHLTVVGNQKTT